MGGEGVRLHELSRREPHGALKDRTKILATPSCRPALKPGLNANRERRRLDLDLVHPRAVGAVRTAGFAVPAARD